MRQRHCEFEPRHRMGEGKDSCRSAVDQEYRHREGTQSSSGEDSLFGSGRGCDQGGDHGLEEETRVGRHWNNGTWLSKFLTMHFTKCAGEWRRNTSKPRVCGSA